MKFAHIADCHIGSWRDPKLRKINLDCFKQAIDKCKEAEVDFIIIAGDLFNNAIPAIDELREVVKKFKELKNQGINIYIVPGSHDFSLTGKSMIDIIEEAGFVKDVYKKFIVDEKSKARITGMAGKKLGLEKDEFYKLNFENIQDGFKIFVFHSAIQELLPKNLAEVDAIPLSLLPRNFDYYAAGHLHIRKVYDFGKGKIVYPGPLFPGNFEELEKLASGSFIIYNNGNIEWQYLQPINVFPIKVDCNGKTAEEVRQEILGIIKDKEFNNTIVLLRLEGVLSSGRISDIGLKEITDMLKEKLAYAVLRNTSKLSVKEFKDVKIEADSVEEIENKILKERLKEININNKEKFVKEIIDCLSEEMNEEMKKNQYEDLILKRFAKIIHEDEDLS